MLSHRNLLFMAAGSGKVRSVRPDDRLYGVLPMSHAVGLSVVLLGSLIAGASLYLTPRFDPMTARVTLEKERHHVAVGTPAIFNQLLQYAQTQKDFVPDVSCPSDHLFFRRSARLLRPSRESKAFSAWCCTMATV